MSPRIRVSSLEDLPALMELQARCFPVDAWSEAALRAEISRADGVSCVVEVDARVAGFGFAWVVGETLEILQVAVDPLARRSGLGRRIVEQLHAGRGEAEQAFLEVRADNEAALALYRASGYTDVHVRRRYYADGCDARILRRPLP